MRALRHAMTRLLPLSTLYKARIRRHRELVALYKQMGADEETAWRVAAIDLHAELHGAIR
jgi:hypothetical protein